MPLITKEFALATATGKHGSGQVNRVQNHIAHFEAGFSGCNGLGLECGGFLQFEVRTMAAGVAKIFDNLIWGCRIAQNMRAFIGHRNGGKPFAWRRGSGQSRGKRRSAQQEEKQGLFCTQHQHSLSH